MTELLNGPTNWYVCLVIAGLLEDWCAVRCERVLGTLICWLTFFYMMPYQRIKHYFKTIGRWGLFNIIKQQCWKIRILQYLVSQRLCSSFYQEKSLCLYDAVYNAELASLRSLCCTYWLYSHPHKVAFSHLILNTQCYYHCYYCTAAQLQCNITLHLILTRLLNSCTNFKTSVLFPLQKSLMSIHLTYCLLVLNSLYLLGKDHMYAFTIRKPLSPFIN